MKTEQEKKLISEIDDLLTDLGHLILDLEISSRRRQEMLNHLNSAKARLLWPERYQTIDTKTTE